MKTPALILASVVLALATPQPGRAQVPATGKVLVLDNDRTLEGDVDRVDDQYRVRRSVGITWVPAERVLTLCKDRNEALAFLRKRANLQDPDERLRLARWCHLQGLRDEALAEVRAAVELRPDHDETRRLARYLDQAVRQAKATPETSKTVRNASAVQSDLPPLTINAESLSQFATRVQPILMNACAKCHAASGHESAFRLERTNSVGLVNRRAVQVNLTSVLAQLHGKQPERSPLLVKAISAHGPISDAPLKGRQVEAFHALEDWVRVTLANNPHLSDSIKPPLELLSRAGAAPRKESRPLPRKADDRKSRPAAPAAPSVAEEPSSGAPESEFDPILFNREAHPDRVTPARSPVPPERSMICSSTRLLRHPACWFLIVGIALTVRILHRPHSHTVFPVFVGASQHWWDDESLYLDYAPLDFFRYPPQFAVLFTPLSLAGTTLGGILWGWLSLGVYGLGVSRLLRDVLPGEWTPHQTWCFTFFALLGALAGLWNGQSNALLTGLLLLGTSSAMRRRWWSAALLVALPVVLKLTPLPLCLLLCVLWPRRLPVRLAVCVLAGFLIPFLTGPPEMVVSHFQDWIAHLSTSSSERWPGFRDGWTCWVVLDHLVEGGSGLPYLKEPMTGNWYRLVQLAGGLTVFFWTLWLKRRRVEERLLVTLVLSAGAAWLMLLGPAAEHPTFAFLAPFLAWGVSRRRETDRGRWLVWVAGLFVFVLGWGSLTRPLWAQAPWLILALPVGTGFFAAWLTVHGGQAVRDSMARRPVVAGDSPLSLELATVA